MADEQVVRVTGAVSIPLGELRFQFSRSSGPGGQHVNKASTQVELTFDVARSPSLSDAQRQRAMRALGRQVSGEGVLRLTCQTTRSQHRNREEVMARFAALLRRALHVPKQRRRTRPTRASRQRRLAAKQRRSKQKRQRRWRPDENS